MFPYRKLQLTYFNIHFPAMEHKGLIYTATAIAIIAIMAAIIAFSLRSSETRTIFLDSYPSGAEVWLDGEKVGETPLALDDGFFKSKGFGIENFPLARLFTHNLGYLELAAPEYSAGGKPSQGIRRGRISFVSKPASSAVPKVFDGAKPLNEMGPMRRDIELLLRLPDENRLIAVFNKDRMPQMDPMRKIRADATVFAAPMSDAGVSMSDFKSCRVLPSSDFRARRP